LEWSQFEATEAWVLGEFEVGKFRLVKRGRILLGVMIAGGVALNAGWARAETPQCKLSSTPQFETDWQGADVMTQSVASAGMRLAQKGYWDGEIEDEDQALDLPGATPNMLFDAAMSLSDAYWHEGKFPDAIAAANTALMTNVDDSLAYEQRAIMEFNNNDMGDTISDATKALAIDPCQKEAYVTRSAAYRREHLVGQSTADDARVIAIDTGFIQQNPCDKNLYMNRGFDEEGQQKYDQAIADFTKAISLDPKDAEAFDARGDAYASEGRYVDDVNDQTAAITLDAKDASAWNDLCEGLAEAGDLNDAMASCNEALTLAPRGLDFSDSRGFVDLKMKNYTQAVGDYGNVLSVDPEFAPSLYGRGLAEQALGDLRDSTADIEKAEQNDPNIATDFAKQE